MGAGGALGGALACVLLVGCGPGAGPKSGSPDEPTAPVPAHLAAGCPPDDTPLRLAAGDLPSGAVGVRLCPGTPTVGDDGTRSGPFVQPVADELTVGVAPLVDLVNSLPEHEPSDCPFDGSPFIVYWFRYPDGDARAVAYGERGCHTLVVGEDRGREEGQKLAQAFADALLSQRAGTTAATPQSPPPARPDCPLPTTETPVSMLPQVPPTLAAATWCQGIDSSRVRSAPVPPSLLRRLNRGLLSAPAQGRDRCTPVDYGQSVEGINAWGDRVSYWVVSDCRVYARRGYGREAAWTTFEASPDLISALRALPATEVEVG